MDKEQIHDEVSLSLRNEMESVWDINRRYWYPLNECKRSDLIAFNADYIEDDKSKHEFILTVLKEHGIEQIYEFLETGETYRIQISDLHPFYGYYGAIGGEGFWCSDKMDWIIYASHEGTITFGGEWLVSKLKSVWIDWRNHVDWDSKN
ncbi:hypothetical protein GC102_28985 [Paenibacillus sp. LMG 31460]|uniref:Uncharacterized protein n=1 Tax=Paenibacillus germinis TaxID=2654979 RepID=A0ABX1Z8W7_9BACL|nr:hypothetical protein [Paenibacillus germinis]NOU89756.1 hypothetical protein [Paenibacillus germinis]